MTTTAYQRNKESSNRRRKIFFAIGTVIILILLATTALGTWASRAATVATRPVWSAGGFFGREIDALIAILSSKVRLAEENETWRTEVARARVALIGQNALRAENEELRAILGRTGTSTAPFYGRVLSKPNQSPYDILFVDLGAENTNRLFRAGDRVMTSEELIVGEVAAVYGKTAKIRLFSSPGVERPVLVGENEIASLSHGQGGGNFSVNLPRSLEVKEGDPVKTNFNGELFLMGIVTRRKSDPSDAFQEVSFKNPANIYELKSVEIYHD